MMRRANVVFSLALMLLTAAVPLSAQDSARASRQAADHSLVTLLPVETLIAVDASDLGASLGKLMALPAWLRFEAGPLGEAVDTSPEIQKALTGLTALAAAAGTTELELVDALTGGGSALGLLPPAAGSEQPQTLVLFRARNAEAVQRAFNGLLTLMTLGTTRVSGAEWRLPLGEVLVERRDDLFLVGSSAEALNDVGAGETSLAGDPDYRSARSMLGNGDIRVWARGAAFQTSPGIPEKAQDVAASFLVGGLSAALRTAPWAAAKLEFGEAGLSAYALTPAVPEELRRTHAPLLPAPTTVALPKTSSRLATLIFQRDLGPWWTARDDFVSEGGVAESIEADGNLSVVFQRDLGSEIMAWLEPELVLVLDRNRFDRAAPEPEFPAGALGLTPRSGHPEDYHQAFVNAFFAVVTFTNFDGGNDATRSMLQPDMELLDDGSRLYAARYRESAGEAPKRTARANLSPGLLVHRDGRLWLGSSAALLEDIAAAETHVVEVDRDTLRIDMGPTRQLIEANEEIFFAQRLLEDGGDLLAAQGFVERLFAATELFDDVQLDAGLQSDRFELSFAMTSR